MTEPAGGGTPPAGGGGETPPAGGTTPVSFNSSDEHTQHVNTNWRNFVDKEYGEHSATANLNSLNDVLKSYVNAQKMIGVDKIAKPNEKWGEEDWKQFYRAGGMPESPDNYQIGRPTDAPENYPYNPEEEKWFAGVVHENGLNNQQAQTLWNRLHAKRIEAWNSGITNKQTNYQEGWNKLKSELGQTFDAKLKNANAVMAKFDTDGSVRKYLQQTGLIDSPIIAQFVMRIADNFAEDKIGNQQNTVGGLTPKQAKAKARELLTKMDKVERGTFEHKQLLDQYIKLQTLAGGAE